MKIATWNVNSIKVRIDRLISWLARHEPDVLCLQELKVTDENFPYEPLKELGYHVVVAGQRTYNGVAIIAREPLADVTVGLGDDVEDPQARLIAATVQGVRVISVYVPNGSSVGSDKYAYKLAWFKRLRTYLATRHRPEEALVVCGDFNVAPTDNDVARRDKWAHSVLCFPEVRQHLEHVTGWGLRDVFAMVHPEGGVYSWWDYRMLGFVKNDGLRIDMIYATASLAAQAHEAGIDRDERKGTLPSDHVPCWATFVE